MNKLQEISQKGKDFFHNRRKWVWIGVGVLAAGLVAATFIPMGADEITDENVQYAQVMRGSITESIGEVGFVEAEPSAAVIWNSGGIVADYSVAVGDYVEKDQVLLELEFSSWPNASLEAQADLLDAQLELENLITADTDLQSALLAVTDAEWALRDKKEDRDAWNWAQSPDDRIDAVRTSYLASVQDYWAAEAEYEALRIALDADDPDLEAAFDALQTADFERDKLLRALNQILGHSYDNDVETDFIEYDQALDDLAVARMEYERQLDNSQEIAAARARVQALENTVNNARILAPFDGTVTYIAYLPGENAESGEVAIQIDDLDNLVVNTTITEVDIAKIAIGQDVIVKFDALPYKEYSGVVTRIASAGNNNSDTTEFDVSATITNPDKGIKSGFSADISIIIGQAENALLVPNEALLGQNGNYRVMVFRDGQEPMPVPVQIGASSDAYTEIISGDIYEEDQLMIITNLSGSQSRGSGLGLMGGMGQVTGGGGNGGGSGSGK